MALQGDLNSFALPDVLRLLAGTAKTGRLVVDSESDRATGEVWLRDGGLVGGTISSAPHADAAADLVFEMLRFDGGSFLFDDGEQLVDGTEPVDVNEALAAAEHLVGEWVEVEAVVPSLRSWITLTAEIEHDTHVTPDQWRVLAMVGAGATVQAIGDTYELTELAASRQVKALVEAGLVAVGPVRDEEPAAPEATEVADNDADADDEGDDAHDVVDGLASPDGTEDNDRFAPAETLESFASFDNFDPDDIFTDAPRLAPRTRDSYERDLALLSAEGGPVVLESSDDAHLPEPLPGEGTSFLGDLGSIAVDGRTLDALHSETARGATDGPVDTWSSYGSFGEPAPAPTPPVSGGWADIVEPSTDATAATDAGPSAPASADDDRGSLLKFLSTVKP